MTWEEVKRKQPIYLNIGGGTNCHPQKGYENYISVDAGHYPSEGEWIVRHDLRNPIPLPDNSVERILSEDFLEHVTLKNIKKIISECFRLIKPGGFARIGVPDYNNPKDKPYLVEGKDPRYPGHITLTHYELMKQIIDQSPFKRYKFYHYWLRDKYMYENIDYSLGMIKRTPDNDPLCRRVGLRKLIFGSMQDISFILSKACVVQKEEFLSRPGHRLHVTSLVVDMFK